MSILCTSHVHHTHITPISHHITFISQPNHIYDVCIMPFTPISHQQLVTSLLYHIIFTSCHITFTSLHHTQIKLSSLHMPTPHHMISHTSQAYHTHITYNHFGIDHIHIIPYRSYITHISHHITFIWHHTISHPYHVMVHQTYQTHIAPISWYSTSISHQFNNNSHSYHTISCPHHVQNFGLMIRARGEKWWVAIKAKWGEIDICG